MRVVTYCAFWAGLDVLRAACGSVGGDVCMLSPWAYSGLVFELGLDVCPLCVAGCGWSWSNVCRLIGRVGPGLRRRCLRHALWGAAAPAQGMCCLHKKHLPTQFPQLTWIQIFRSNTWVHNAARADLHSALVPQSALAHVPRLLLPANTAIAERGSKNTGAHPPSLTANYGASFHLETPPYQAILIRGPSLVTIVSILERGE